LTHKNLLYFAIVIDLLGRYVVGYETGNSLPSRAQLCPRSARLPLSPEMPRLSEALGERPEALSVTPISTPVDLFFDENVSISCTDLNVTLPAAERERSRVAVTLLMMTVRPQKTAESSGS
jgi:hypothetical protein